MKKVCSVFRSMLACLGLLLPVSALADGTFVKVLQANLDQSDRDGCWFCKIFVGEDGTPGGIFLAINNLTKELFNNLVGPFLALMGMGILFLILFKVGKMLVQLQAVDLMQFLNDLFKPLGRAIIATALLGATVVAGQQTIFYLLTNPVLESSMRLGTKILELSLEDVKHVVVTENSDMYVGSEMERVKSLLENNLGITSAKWEEIDTVSETANAEKSGDMPLEESQRLILLEWMKSVSSSFIVGISMGQTFIKIGFHDFWKDGHIPMLLSGLIMFIGFWAIYLLFPLKLVDAFVRVAFVLALMPLWIVLWVFPATQQYTKKAWEMFLSACLLFAVLSIMIGLSLMLINRVVPTTLYSDAGSISRSEFFEKLIGGYDDDAMKYTTFGSGLCLNALAYTAMAFSLLEAAATIANSFIGGGGNIQTNVAGGMTQAVTNTGRLAKSVGRAAGKVGMWAAPHVGRGTAALYHWGRNRWNGGGFGGEGGGSGGSDPTPPPAPDPNSGGGGGQPAPIVVNGPAGRDGKDGRDGRDAPAPTNPSGVSDTHRPTLGESDAPKPSESPKPSTGGSALSSLTPDAQDNVRRRAVHNEEVLAGAAVDPAAKTSMMAQAGPREKQALNEMEEAMHRGGDLTPARRNLQEAIAQDRLAGRHGEAAAGIPAADGVAMSLDRKDTVAALAKNPQAMARLNGLIEDTSFIEQNLSLGRDNFKQAMEEHAWRSDSKEMKALADRVFNAKDSPASAGIVAKDMVKPAMEGLSFGRTTASEIGDEVSKNIESGGQFNLSAPLKRLAAQASGGSDQLEGIQRRIGRSDAEEKEAILASNRARSERGRAESEIEDYSYRRKT